jgi:hypothetical protein
LPVYASHTKKRIGSLPVKIVIPGVLGPADFALIYCGGLVFGLLPLSHFSVSP